MTSRNLSLRNVCENTRHPHDFPYKLFTEKLHPPLTLRTTTKPINFPSRILGFRLSLCNGALWYVSQHNVIDEYPE